MNSEVRERCGQMWQQQMRQVFPFFLTAGVILCVCVCVFQWYCVIHGRS